jgi:hypothetical protein
MALTFSYLGGICGFGTQFALGISLFLGVPKMQDAGALRLGVDQSEAVRLFHRWVSPEAVHAWQPPTKSTVYTAWVVLWLMVDQRLHGNAPLTGAIAAVQRLSSDLLPNNKRLREGTLSSSTGGYARARQRLNVEVAEQACDQVTRTMIAETTPALGKRRALLIDGSTLSLAPADALRTAYPPARNQHGASHWPLLRLVTAHELSSGAAFRPEIGQANGPKAVGEVALSAGLLPRLPAGSVLIGDRNFGVFGFAWMAQRAGHDYVLRLTEKRFRALARAATPVAAGRWQLAWRPSRYDRASHPHLPDDAVLQVGLHEVQVSATTTLWLVSGLSETSAVLAELYLGRQHIETDLHDLKHTLRLEDVRGRSAAMVRKELAAATIAYNLVILIRRLAAAQVCVPPRRLSFSRIWQLVQRLLFDSSDLSHPPQAKARLELVLRLAGQCKLPHRPGRHYPREVIPRRRKFPDRPPHPPPQARK